MLVLAHPQLPADFADETGARCVDRTGSTVVLNLNSSTVVLEWVMNSTKIEPGDGINTMKERGGQKNI